MDLRTKIQTALNQACAENDSNTPDYILAEYLINCLNAFNTAVCLREAWYGRVPEMVDTASSAVTVSNDVTESLKPTPADTSQTASYYIFDYDGHNHKLLWASDLYGNLSPHKTEIITDYSNLVKLSYPDPIFESKNVPMLSFVKTQLDILLRAIISPPEKYCIAMIWNDNILEFAAPFNYFNDAVTWVSTWKPNS